VIGLEKINLITRVEAFKRARKIVEEYKRIYEKESRIETSLGLALWGLGLEMLKP
jgi:hypothetical protein